MVSHPMPAKGLVHGVWGEARPLACLSDGVCKLSATARHGTVLYHQPRSAPTCLMFQVPTAPYVGWAAQNPSAPHAPAVPTVLTEERSWAGAGKAGQGDWGGQETEGHLQPGGTMTLPSSSPTPQALCCGTQLHSGPGLWAALSMGLSQAASLLPGARPERQRAQGARGTGPTSVYKYAAGEGRVGRAHC